MIKKFFRTHIESIIIILFSLIGTLSIFFIFKDTYLSFYTNEFNYQLIGLFGNLLGLLLTAYAIIFGLIPALSKEFLDSNSFDRLNKRFAYTTLTNLLLLILSIIFNFLDVKKYIILLFLHLFLMIFSFSMIFLLVLYLYFLFKIAKKK